MSLFEPDSLAREQNDATRPLAERMRPTTLEDFVGQSHILAPGKPLRSQIDSDQLGSIILWGPPGVGKTTLARIIARLTHADFIPFSAVLSGIKEIKAVMADAERNKRLGRRTSFEVISALLSRTKVYMLKPLSEDEIAVLLKRALPLLKVEAPDELLQQIAIYANGDGRAAYNLLELAAAASKDGRITEQAVEDSLQRKMLLYDKSGEEHFNIISALHKSVRSSDVDAALATGIALYAARKQRMVVT